MDKNNLSLQFSTQKQETINQNLYQRIKDLEITLQQIKQDVQTSKFLGKNGPLQNQQNYRKDVPEKKDTWTIQLANEVTAIVGLKEAITWKYTWLKLIWSIALCLGITSTVWVLYETTSQFLDEPTATQVRIKGEPTYEYPPILICPDVWADVDKAISLGLSIEGVKYSMGYTDKVGDKVPPDDVNRARREFLDFYQKNNFTNYEDYLMKITPDMPIEQTMFAFGKNVTTNAYCNHCDRTDLPKIFMSGSMCYNFQLKPEIENALYQSMKRMFLIRIKNNSRNVIETKLWRIYVGPNLAVRSSTVPSIYVPSFTFGRLRIKMQRFISLKTKENPCLTRDEIPKNYSSEICRVDCLRKIRKQIFRCRHFWETTTTNRSNYHPNHLCNNFDNSTLWAEVKDSIDATDTFIAKSKNFDECYRNCPYECEVCTYEATIQAGIQPNDVGRVSAYIFEMAKKQNFSMILQYVENAASYESGIMTWTEINTISGVTWISNIGGILGLFVGGTIMTFVQLILFSIKYFLEKRKSM